VNALATGPYTWELVRRLAHKCSGTRYRLFYDPHQGGYPAIRDAVACHPSPYFGEHSSSSTLSVVDVAILDTSAQQVVLVIEVEEHGAEPKRVIGDLVNIALADAITLSPYQYEFQRPLGMILGIRVNPAGKGEEKVTRIAERLNALFGNRVFVTPLFSGSLDDLINAIGRAALRKLNLC
jgi:hypothetical protein